MWEKKERTGLSLLLAMMDVEDGRGGSPDIGQGRWFYLGRKLGDDAVEGKLKLWSLGVREKNPTRDIRTDVSRRVLDNYYPGNFGLRNKYSGVREKKELI